ncbi:hypothetical protein OZN62_06775 [Aurantiacibacter sp. MUD11]|uniref:hypothetical protein n=1 Tax=Aurantiacibacter sp. MUD11 TaxID=3003265 RepID=UPI0022AB082C|nr:hypothetical protein [Aurantiacibacter sp. MUD11]WAT19262.1 hypothetical protein OZN62_06775 [Aurantiacibacter sp. MUD11]
MATYKPDLCFDSGVRTPIMFPDRVEGARSLMKVPFKKNVVLISLVIAMGMAIFFVSQAEKENWLPVTLLIGLIGWVVMLSTVYLSDLFKLSDFEQRSIVSGRSLAILTAATAAAASAQTTVTPFIEPKAAQESTPLIIERTVADSNRILQGMERQADNRAELAGRISGRWGRANCRTILDFELENDTLQISALKIENGTTDWEFVGTILSARNDTLEVRAELPVEALGQTASFELDDQGPVHTLTWNDRTNRDSIVELVRCE